MNIDGKDPADSGVQPGMTPLVAAAGAGIAADPAAAYPLGLSSADPEEFMALVREHDPALRALAFRLLDDRHLMDDALQEAYIKAFRAREAYRGEAAVGTWLYRITYNVCLDLLRSRSRRPAEPLDTAYGVASAAGDPGDIVATRVDLSAALSALPPEQRAAVLLVDAEGLDYAAAGEVLGVAPGTVGSRVSRGRAALRAALTPGELR